MTSSPQTTLSATAIAHPNIAFIKYWGNRNSEIRLPSNSSFSMNLEDLSTKTSVTFSPILKQDTLILNGQRITGEGLTRVARFLEQVRMLGHKKFYADVVSVNNFPTGAGIASSASAFAALSLAASRAIGLELSEQDLSRLARRGSGSACRSIPDGYVEWQKGHNDRDSFAYTFVPSIYWDLVDCIAVVQSKQKTISSTEGHLLADTSPLQSTRVIDSDRRLLICKQAVQKRDFNSFAEVVELDSNMMHAVMMTSSTPLFYWDPASLAVIKAVQSWRKQGMQVCYTLDAGPNVHCICPVSFAEDVIAKLKQIPGVLKVLSSRPGGPTQLIDE
jgi:diphosphomevalonate decarboxylase